MKNLRNDFPMLQQQVNGKSLIYFDNAATTHKPSHVIDAIANFYRTQNAPVHRGIYPLAEQATQLYEDARATVARFIGAANPAEIVFTSGTTQSINTIAFGWGLQHIRAGDEIVITELEHHSNMVPWQQVAHATGAKLRYIPVRADGTLDLTTLSLLINERTKLVSVTHVSNFFGSRADVAVLSKAARAVGAYLFIDAAQSVGHERINVQHLQPDFLAFSGHKVYGPTGIGVLYVRKGLHDQMSPASFGGGMVRSVTWHRAQWHPMPLLLQAGTPPIAQAVGLAAALEYLRQHVDYNWLQQHEAALCAQLIKGLEKLPKVTVLGPTQELKKAGHIVSFMVEGIHPHDVAAYLAPLGICVRAGNHCSQPLSQKWGITGTVRVSFALYNAHDEVEQLMNALEVLLKV